MFEYRGTLRSAQGGPMVGLAAQVLLLAALAATAGLGLAGWLAGLACGVAMDAALAYSLRRHRSERIGPAGWVTLVRSTLAVGVAALTADSFGGPAHAAPVVALAAVALALDFVDGHVARRTGTESTLGARWDGEVDAFLILVLAVYVAPSAGAWVLLIGLARYAFLVAGWLVGWMRAPLPRRDWRKTVTATQGVTLTIAAAGVLPSALTRAALAAALALLAESFGRDVWWLWSHRSAAARQMASVRERAAVADADRGAGRGRVRVAVSAVITVLAFLLVWAALVAPDEPGRFTPGAFVKLPLEGVIVIALALALPAPARRLLAWVVGPAIGLLIVVKVLDFGFFTAFDRPFNPGDDWSYTHIGIETLRESIGRTRANLALGGGALLVVAAFVLPTLAMLRLNRVVSGHRRVSLQAVTALGLIWVLCWGLGAQLVSGARIASTSAADLAVTEVRTVQADIRDRALFAAEIRHDPYADTPGNQLLTGLRGKDVLLVFVESYGQVAVQGSSFSPKVDGVLDAGTRQLQSAGFGARSGWLSSSTFGGISWLAHSTMQSGLWIDTPSRYDQVVASNRLTLSTAFKRAGWRTVGDVPSDNRPWPEGTSFYHFDKVYNRLNVGYHGPTYAYASMPDQYVYLALQRLELGKSDRPPLFAEVDLVSSHEPWTQVPPLIEWNRVGDGSVFYRLPVDMSGQNDGAQQGYGDSIEYTMSTLFSFVQHYARKNLVMVVLGDHQPATTVSGLGATHDVPISIIAHDPSVLQRIRGWGWVDGMRPSPHAPVWPMSAFRDRFLSAFGSEPATPGSS
ncbi:MAG TPA: CDP-alcohol phosphatidyltransferase family protein [Gaiellales bacterium]|nr:CDP-alcohol phosphatidyltransferase family protein [Gaiellales bacterium]